MKPNTKLRTSSKKLLSINLYPRDNDESSVFQRIHTENQSCRVGKSSKTTSLPSSHMQDRHTHEQTHTHTRRDVSDASIWRSASEANSAVITCAEERLKVRARISRAPRFRPKSSRVSLNCVSARAKWQTILRQSTTPTTFRCDRLRSVCSRSSNS